MHRVPDPLRDLPSKELAMQLNLNHISYTYPGTVSAAIDDVSVTFPSGWTGIIGDNGCGKSTLARIAAHSIAPDSGTVGPKLFSAYCQQDSTQEPDNLLDLDAVTRGIVREALASFGSSGILISHDRALLYSLVSQGLMCEGCVGPCDREGTRRRVDKRPSSALPQSGTARRPSTKRST